MKTRVLISCLFIMAGLLAAIPAKADDIPIGSWNTYDEWRGGVGSLFLETWVATQNETVMITDLYVVGDSFSVFVDGSPIPVLTTAVVADWSTYGLDPFGALEHYTTDPNVAWADAAFSKGTFALNVGDYVTIQLNTEPSTFTDSTVAISATTVPEPGLMLLLFLGLGAVGLIGWRFKA